MNLLDMRRFFYLFAIGLLTSAALCFALTVVWYALVLLCRIPFVQKSLEGTFLGRAFWLFSAVLYVLYALSIPVGQIYSFCLYRRRQIHP